MKFEFKISKIPQSNSLQHKKKKDDEMYTCMHKIYKN